MKNTVATATVDRLMADGPVFHAGGTRVWNALPGTLQLLARLAAEAEVTVETGAGASTVIFASAGTRHTAISPAADEHQRIADYCHSIGVDTGRLTFIADSSDRALPALALDQPIDLAFIDGKHSFPLPVVDFHYIEQRMRVGGVLVLDDVPMPTVAVAHRYIVSSPDWEMIDIADNRAVAYRKLADADPDDNWHLQPFNRGYPDYSFVPIADRIRLGTEHRVRQGAKAVKRQLRTMSRRTPAGE